MVRYTPPPLDQTPPSRHPPSGPDPPRSRPPGSRHPPEQSPPGADPPPEADFSIRSTSGRYASYWNAFLFNVITPFQTEVIRFVVMEGGGGRLNKSCHVAPQSMCFGKTQYKCTLGVGGVKNFVVRYIRHLTD